MRLWFVCLLTLAAGLVPAAVRADATPDGNNGAIVYTCGEDAFRSGIQVYPEGICLTDPDGTNSRRLDTDRAAFTSSPGGDGEAVWSPDGTRIAWVRAVGQAQSGTIKELFIMNADGSAPSQLTHLGAYVGSPAWSHDGEEIAFELNNGISLVDVEGGTTRSLIGSSSGPAADPAWSPDGARIAFVAHGGFYCRPGSDVCLSRNALHSMAADGTDQRLLSSVGDLDLREPSWSPDGTTIAVGCSNRLCLVPREGGDPRRLDVEGASPSWSPDGLRIAFSRVTYRSTAGGPQSDVHLCVVSPDGSNARRIAAGADPHWQPLASGRLEESKSALPCPRTPLSRRPDLLAVDVVRGRVTARFGSLAGVDSATVFIATEPYRHIIPGGWKTSGHVLQDSLTANEIASQSWTNEEELPPGRYHVRVETGDFDCDPCISGYSEQLVVTVPELKKVARVKRAKFSASVKVSPPRGTAVLRLSVRPLTRRLPYTACWTLKKGRRCAHGAVGGTARKVATHTLRIRTKGMRRVTTFTWFAGGRVVAKRRLTF